MSDSTLFMQLQVFDIEPAAGPRAMVSALSRRLREKKISAVIYGDANDHRGIGLLTWAADPGAILDNVHALLGGKRFSALTPRPGWVMLGHLSGENADGAAEKALAAAATWGTWYPTKDNKEPVAKPLVDSEQVDFVRLSSFGIDAEGNHSVFGLLAADLLSISELQEAMTGTSKATPTEEKAGPVFVGRRIWQNPELAGPEEEAAGDESEATEAAATAEASAGAAADQNLAASDEAAEAEEAPAEAADE